MGGLLDGDHEGEQVPTGVYKSSEGGWTKRTKERFSGEREKRRREDKKIA